MERIEKTRGSNGLAINRERGESKRSRRTLRGHGRMSPGRMRKYEKAIVAHSVCMHDIFHSHYAKTITNFSQLAAAHALSPGLQKLLLRKSNIEMGQM